MQWFTGGCAEAALRELLRRVRGLCRLMRARRPPAAADRRSKAYYVLLLLFQWGDANSYVFLNQLPLLYLVDIVDKRGESPK